MITIAVINHSTVCTDADVNRWTQAIHTQVNRDFAPVWGVDALVTFYRAGTTVPPYAWPVYILDTADVEGALGYHDEGPNARPFGRVFAKTTLADGEEVSVTLSHEILEMLGDPYVRLAVFIETAHGGRLYAYETADACEAVTYAIDHVNVSDFVYPAYFDPSATKKGTKYDYLGKIKKPFQILKGGYLSVYTTDGGGWQQLQAEHAHAMAHELATVNLPKPGSRRERRNHPAHRTVPA